MSLAILKKTLSPENNVAISKIPILKSYLQISWKPSEIREFVYILRYKKIPRLRKSTKTFQRDKKHTAKLLMLASITKIELMILTFTLVSFYCID